MQQPTTAKLIVLSCSLFLGALFLWQPPQIGLADKAQPAPSPAAKTDKADLDPEAKAALAEALAFEAKLKFQQGKLTLGKNLATLNVPEQYRYLDAAQTREVLTKLWGNPPSESNILGGIFPQDSLVSGAGWGVIITYEEDGYVDDKEAANIDYTAMLKEMQGSEAETNEERKQAGYESVHVVGWAETPHYDKTERKLYWAKEIEFGGSADHTLNYDVRVLGRQGVLSLNAVAGMEDLTAIKTAMQSVMKFVEFNPGSRYADYKPGTDKLAAYGIGALIAGKVAAKAGLFKLLLAGLIAAKKFVVIGVVALGALLKRLFTGRSSETDSVG